MTNALALLMALVILAAAAGGAAVYASLYEGESVYALSRLGSTGSEVKSIQTKLQSLGFYKGTGDGIYGTQTRNAVLAVQR